MTKPLFVSLAISLGVLGIPACERKPEAASGTRTPAEAAPENEKQEEAASPPQPADPKPPPADARHEKIETKLRQLVADRLKIPLERVVPEAQLARDLGVSELDRVQLVMAMEEEFNVTITDEYADKIKTVGDAVKILIWLGAR